MADFFLSRKTVLDRVATKLNAQLVWTPATTRVPSTRIGSATLARAFPPGGYPYQVQELPSRSLLCVEVITRTDECFSPKVCLTAVSPIRTEGSVLAGPARPQLWRGKRRNRPLLCLLPRSARLPDNRTTASRAKLSVMTWMLCAVYYNLIISRSGVDPFRDNGTTNRWVS